MHKKPSTGQEIQVEIETHVEKIDMLGSAYDNNHKPGSRSTK